MVNEHSIPACRAASPKRVRWKVCWIATILSCHLFKWLRWHVLLWKSSFVFGRWRRQKLQNYVTECIWTFFSVQFKCGSGEHGDSRIGDAASIEKGEFTYLVLSLAEMRNRWRPQTVIEWVLCEKSASPTHNQPQIKRFDRRVQVATFSRRQRLAAAVFGDHSVCTAIMQLFMIQQLNKNQCH